MLEFQKIISLLMAFQNVCYDLHYMCVSYELHLLAQRLYEDIDDMLDSIKEKALIAYNLPVFPSKVYAVSAAHATPISMGGSIALLKTIQFLATKITMVTASIETNMRANNVLLDDVAGKMAEAKALVNIQLRKISMISENEDEISEAELEKAIQEAFEVLTKFEKQNCKGCKEVPVDREVRNKVKVATDKTAEVVLDYSNQHAAMCESALDRVSKKLGV